MAGLNNGNFIVDGGDGSSGSGSSTTIIKASAVGTPTSIDVYNSSWNQSSRSQFVGDGLTSIKIEKGTSSDAYILIHKIEVYVGSVLWRTVSFIKRKTMLFDNVDYDFYPLSSSTSPIEIGLYSEKTYREYMVSGSQISYKEKSTVVLNNSPTFTNAGSKRITIKVFYKKSNSDPDSNISSSCSTKEYEVTNVGVLSPYVSSINISGGKRSFYCGDSFDYSSLVVTANYKYEVDGGSSHSATVTGYSVSNMSSEFVDKLYSSKTATVTVSYGGKSASYSITIYGVSNYTKPGIQSVRSTSYFRKGESYYTIGNSVITYGDGTTESIAPTVTGFDTETAGYKNAYGHIASTKAGTTFDYDIFYTVVSMSSISLNTAFVNKNFYMDDTFSYANLVVTANYGSAGTESVSLDNAGLSVSFPAQTVGAGKTVGVYYDDGYDIRLATYTINVNGLYDMRHNLSAPIRVQKNGALAYGNVPFQVRRYANGVLGNWASGESVPTVTASAVDTSQERETTVEFSCTERGATVSCTANVTVFEIDSIEVSGVPARIFYEDDDYPTIDLSAFSVEATTSDGYTQALTYNAVSNGYEVVIGGVVQSEDEITLTQSTQIEVRSKSEPSVSETFTIEIIQKTAKTGGELRVTGQKIYVMVGEKVDPDKNGYVVLQEMNDGTFERIYDYEVTIDGKDGNVFDDEDTLGDNYDLVFSKYPSADTTVEEAVMLDGVKDIKNLSASKTIYDIGERFDKHSVTFDLEYYHAPTQTNQSWDDETCFELLQRDYALADANSNNGKVVLNVSIHGVQGKFINTYVRKITTLTKAAVGTADYNYKIFDSISPSAHNYKFRATYNYAKDGVDTIDVPDSDLSFSFSNAGAGCSASSLVPLTSSDEVSVTASYTKDGATATATAFNISVVALKDVTLIDSDTNEVTALHLDKGDQLDLSAYRLFVEMNNGTSRTLAIDSNLTLSPEAGTYINAKVEGATITYTYVQGNSMSAEYDIHIHYTSSITTNLGSIVDSTYYIGDTIDLSEITASKTISSTDESEDGYPITESIDSIPLVFNTMNVSGTLQFATAGNFSLSFTVDGITESESFSVYAVELSSISKTTSAAFKALDSYVEGQRLDLTGLTITKTYNNSATADVAYNDASVQVVDGDGETFSKTKELSLADDDVEIFAKITENGITKTVSIGTLTVAANELSSIEVASTSTHGTTFTYGDKFSVDGLAVKANFSNGSSQLLLVSSLSISGATVGHTFNPTNDSSSLGGTIAIGLSYTYDGVTKTTSYNITLAKPVLSSIRTNATSDAVVTQFVNGTAYSESGLSVTGVFANGWEYVIDSQDWATNATSVLTLDNGNIDMAGDYGAKTITVTADNPFDSDQAAVTTTYTVDIMTNGAITSAILMFDEGIDHENYTVGDVFDAKGVYFHITDIDGVESDVRTFATSIAKGSVLRSAQKAEVSCTYTKGSFTFTATYKITVSVANVISLTETNDYKLAVGKSDGSLFSSIEHDGQEILLGALADGTGEYYPLFHEDKVQIDTNSAHSSTYGFNVYTGNDAEGDCIGYIDLGANGEDGSTIRQAHIVLFDDPLNPIDGQGNIEVKFPHYVPGYAEKINKCRFGIVYNNRLFLSGNPDFKSCDWHSSAVNVSQAEGYDRNSDLDFTYFSDLDYCYYGTDDTAIVGYDTYRDGDLIAVKQGSRFQATLYRRSYKLIAAQSYSGDTIDTSLAEEAFPMFDVNANGGIGGLSNRSIFNFVGETLVLTKEGLKAITSKENVYNSAKYSFDVSSYINPKIVGENLENAFAYVFKERIYLKTSRGVYVGYYELRNEDGEYEWYFLCDLPVSIFFEHDGDLYFANDEGGVYRFPENIDSFYDKDRGFIGQGGTYLTLDDANNKIIASNAYADDIVEGKAFHLLTDFTVGGASVSSQVHASLGKFVNENHRRNLIEAGASYSDLDYNGSFDPETGIITIVKRTELGEENIPGTLAIQDNFYDGRKVRFDYILPDVRDLNLFEDYQLSKVGDNQYKIVDASGNVVLLGNTNSMRMCFVVNDLAVTYIKDIVSDPDTGAKSFSLLGDHSQTLDLVYYNNQNGYYSGVVTAENKVKSFYVTAPYSMGAISSVKTIWSWVIANDTNLASYMDVGYISSRKQGGFETIVKSSPASRKLNFDGFDFSKVSFLNDSLPHVYTKHRTLPSVNFIRFVFKNEEDTNIALTAMDIIYTFSGFSKGVK